MELDEELKDTEAAARRLAAAGYSARRLEILSGWALGMAMAYSANSRGAPRWAAAFVRSIPIDATPADARVRFLLLSRVAGRAALLIQAADGEQLSLDLELPRQRRPIRAGVRSCG